MKGLFSKADEVRLDNWSRLSIDWKVRLFGKLVKQVKREWEAEHIAMASIQYQVLPPEPTPTYDEAVAGKP